MSAVSLCCNVLKILCKWQMTYKIISFKKNMPAPELPEEDVSGFWSYRVCLFAGLLCYAGFGVIAQQHLLHVDSAPRTPVTALTDAQANLFNRSTALSSTVLYRVAARTEIHSFAFDLGGTSCACPLQWDRTQYWQRMVYGLKYMTAHCLTAFWAALFFHRWHVPRKTDSPIASRTKLIGHAQI